MPIAEAQIRILGGFSSGGGGHKRSGSINTAVVDGLLLGFRPARGDRFSRQMDHGFDPFQGRGVWPLVWRCPENFAALPFAGTNQRLDGAALLFQNGINAEPTRLRILSQE